MICSNKLRALALVLSTSLVTVVASADTTAAGTKGHVTAYEADGKTVIRVDACPAKKLSFDYPACGSKLRDDVKALLCKRGKGPHKWNYQIADGKQMPQSSTCK